MYSRVPPPSEDNEACDYRIKKDTQSALKKDDEGSRKTEEATFEKELVEKNKPNHDNSTLLPSESAERPKNISQQAWQKFQALRKRREDVSKKSSGKRIRDLQRDLMQKVAEEMHHPEDLDILRKHNIRLPDRTYHKTEQNERKKRKHSDPDANEDRTLGKGTGASEQKEWDNVRQYLGAGDSLMGADLGKHKPKTKLEESIDLCIKEGDINTADELSDKLANREFGKKIAAAIDAKKFVEAKKKEEESAKSKKKQKLPWVFQPKQKWETKSNM